MAKIKTKFYHLYRECKDSDGQTHVVTVVGKFTQENRPQQVVEEIGYELKPGQIVPGTITFNKKTLHRKLTVGVAICHPSDEFDEEIGIKIAKARIEKGQDSGSIETNDVTMITEDLIMAELLGKLLYVTENIDSYLP